MGTIDSPELPQEVFLLTAIRIQAQAAPQMRENLPAICFGPC
jgi:hypothetical protein